MDAFAKRVFISREFNGAEGAETLRSLALQSKDYQELAEEEAGIQRLRFR